MIEFDTCPQQSNLTKALAVAARDGQSLLLNNCSHRKPSSAVKMKRISIWAGTVLACVGLGLNARSQVAAPPPAPAAQVMSADDLDQLLGPIALYPDPLIAEILPAATLPSQIVLADRYLEGGGDPNLVEQQGWDPSVQALARYPSLLKWMDDNLAWTSAVGQAFLNQQQDVMDSIQRLRAQAQALGNLQTTPQEEVLADAGTIEILPANPQVVYVPVYQPALVYSQRSYSGSFISFGVGLAIGAWLNHDFDWQDHHLIVWGHDQPRPADWWSRRPGQRPAAEAARAAVWQPHNPPSPASRGLDRGWETRQPPSTVIRIGGQSGPANQRPAPSAPARRAASSAPPQAAAAPRSRGATGALIGVQSSQQTRQFSTRGQESRQAVARPAASPSRPSAPARPAASRTGTAPGKR